MAVVCSQVQALKRKGPFMYLSHLLQALEGTRWWAWGHCLAAWVAVFISSTYLLTIKSTYPRTSQCPPKRPCAC